MRRLILTEKIARRCRHILQEYTVDPLNFLQAAQLMTPSPETLPNTMTIAETVRYFQETARHRSVPVVDADGALVGMVSRGDALAWKINGALAETTLAHHVSVASIPFAHPDTPRGQIPAQIFPVGLLAYPHIIPPNRSIHRPLLP